MIDEEVKEMFCRPGDERALIHYSLKDINNFYTICSKMTVNDFLYLQHKTMFLIMKSIVDKNVGNLDTSMVISEAQAEGVFSNIGSYDYIRSINEMHLPNENFDTYLENVVEASTKYKLFNSLNDNIDEITKNSKKGKSSADLIGRVENNILDLSTESKAIHEPINLGDGLREYIDEKRTNRVEMSGISTGYPILDKQLDGLVPGTLTVISARKKMGKSTFLSNVASYISFMSKIPVLYIDTEMTFPEWRDRIVAHMSGVKERTVKHGGYNDDQYKRIMKCVKIIENAKLFHEYMPGYSLEKIVALYKKYKIKHGIGLGIFDYLKEPDSSSLDRQRKEYQVLGDVTTKLKDLAGELDIPFLTAVQLNRSNDIADSDRIARYGDVIAQWGEMTADDIEVGGRECGRYKLVIKDSRRGGSTPEHGIGYWFFKQTLSIKEVTAPNQIIKEYGREEVVNYGSGYDDEEELK